MKHATQTTNLCRTAAGAILLLGASAVANAQWTIDWWTIDSGGEILSSGGNWELSGAIGQWDATANASQAGGGWKLTGGFWAAGVTETDVMFRDRFEAD